MKRFNTPTWRLAGLLVPALFLAMTATDNAAAQDTQPAATQPSTEPVETAREDLTKAKKILDDAIKAMGGRAAIEKIKSTRMKAEMTAPMMTVNMEMFWAKPDKFFIKQIVPGMGEMETGFDGTVGWMNNPMMGGYQLLPDEQVEGMKGQANMQMMLMRLEEDSDTMMTVDLLDFHGVQCHKVKFIDTDVEDAPAQYGYFDTTTDLLAGLDVIEESPTGAQTTTVQMQDWQAVGDVKLFRKIILDSMGMAMEIIFTEIEANKVDSTVFDLPESVQELVRERDAAMGDAAGKDGHEGHDHP